MNCEIIIELHQAQQNKAEIDLVEEELEAAFLGAENILPTYKI